MDIQETDTKFEAHIRQTYPDLTDAWYERDEHGRYPEGMQQDWELWQAAKTQAVPEGFVLVPRQPNEKTLIKMSWSVVLGEDQHGNSVYLSIDEAKQAYEAVIEAQEPAND